MILLRIYLLGAIAGLLFPVIDAWFDAHSKAYREVNIKNEVNKNIIDYRYGPWHWKVIASFLPVFNLIWIITLVLMFFFFVRLWRLKLTRCFIRWLSKRKKNKAGRIRFVKKYFPEFKEYYYSCLQKNAGHVGYEKIRKFLDEKPEENEQNHEQ